MTRCLVTGGGGFLGRYIVEQLVARGDSVRSLSRIRYRSLDELGVEQVLGDIRELDRVLDACDSIEVVFHSAHTAGISGPWERYHSINTLGSRNVVLACQQHGVGRLLYCSSPSVTSTGHDQCNIDESVPYAKKWLCNYDRSMAMAEQEILAANTSSLRTCALRPSLMWGPRDQQLLPRLLRLGRAGKLRIIGDGSNQVDTVYVENAAVAHLQAADALAQTPVSDSPVSDSPVSDSPVSAANARHPDIGGRAYFISQGQPVNCWNWINDILRHCEVEPVTKKIPFSVAWFGGHSLEIAYRLLKKNDEPLMTRFLAAQLGRSQYFDISAARRDFGYQPRISTQEGMQRLAKWCGTG